jgi:hypothetical protein
MASTKLDVQLQVCALRFASGISSSISSSWSLFFMAGQRTLQENAVTHSPIFNYLALMQPFLFCERKKLKTWLFYSRWIILISQMSSSFFWPSEIWKIVKKFLTTLMENSNTQVKNFMGYFWGNCIKLKSNATLASCWNVEWLVINTRTETSIFFTSVDDLRTCSPHNCWSLECVI